MRSPALRWLMLAWAAFWLVVYVPGHQRGRVLIAGAERYVEASGGCCGANDTESSADSAAACEPEAPKRVPIDRANHCAVCFVSANTTSTPTIEFRPPTLTLLGELSPPPLASLHSQASIERAKARDPPITCYA